MSAPSTSETLNRRTFYPLAEFHPGKQARSLPHFSLRAQWDGKPPRPPKRGEWYLSGAIIGAYRAPNDLTTPHHIARIYHTKLVTAHVPLEEVAP